MEGGGGKLIGGKAAPYGVAIRIIFVCERGGGGVGLWWCLCDGYEWNMGIFVLVWLWWCYKEGGGQAVVAEPISATAEEGVMLCGGIYHHMMVLL